MTVEDVKQALRYAIRDCFKLYRNRAEDIYNRGIAAGLSVDDIVKAFDAVDPFDILDKLNMEEVNDRS